MNRREGKDRETTRDAPLSRQPTTAMIKATSHTPGPWCLDNPIHADTVDKVYHSIDAGKGFPDDDGQGFGISGCLYLPDARLIAAAPELLAALKAVMERCEVFENVPSDAGRIIESARAAIAKAEGRS